MRDACSVSWPIATRDVRFFFKFLTKFARLRRLVIGGAAKLPPRCRERYVAPMHSVFFETRFRTPVLDADWPREFVIVSAYATTGACWPPERNLAADREIERCLRERGVWMRRITGYSPTVDHAEPSWAAVLPFEDACELGLQFLQVAIYHVADDVLSVSYCDQRRKLIQVGLFSERLDVEHAD